MTENVEIYERTIEPIYDVNDKPKPSEWLLLSSQHLFAMFGSTVLVPYLTGLPVSAALIASGLGTLLYILITKGMIPAYLGSSFAFITPIIIGLKTHSLGEMLMALFMSGLFYVLIGLVIKVVGTDWLLRLLPPVVVGPVIMVIGLGLAPVAVNMAMYTDSGNMKGYSGTYLFIAFVTLITVILFNIFAKGFFSIIPILMGILVGYITALILGVVDLSGVKKAHWIEMPHVYLPFRDYQPTFDWMLILIMVPIVFVTVSEHIGHQVVINKIVGRNFFKNPGLHRSLMGDGISTMVASLIGGPPSTTYGENIGVLAITRIYSVWVIGGAATLALILAFIGKFTALVSSIPTPVMGGVSILLFGIIAASGLRMLVDSKVDFGDKRNLIIASVILVLGIGKAHIDLTVSSIHLNIEGMALAALAGILLNAILPQAKVHE